MSLSNVLVETRNLPEGQSPRGRALILPGARYTVDHPLLSWAAMMLEQCGWQVSAVRWDVSALDGDPADLVIAAADKLAGEAPPAERTLVVGKSLASHAAGWAAVRGYPSVWLTPLLTEPAIRDAIANSTNPTLVVGGSSDPWWVPVGPREGLEIFEIENANHSLRFPDWRDEIRALGDVTDRIERFAARHGASRS
ncbi:MAG: hypothetical protein QM713_14755 [Arachnia sp.]